MARYTGNHCPVCEQAFTDNDDIVVCPDCGTPYHRACWQKVGVCMHRSEHAAGFEWQPEVGAGAAEAAHAAVCPNCGNHNTPGAVRCSHCGCPLPKPGEESQNAPGAAPQPPQNQGPIYARNPGDVNPNAAPRNDPAAPGPHIDTYSSGPDGIQRREIGPEDPIEGIKAKDWAAFVGRSPMYYLMQFFRMSETKQKVTLSLSAFLFGPAYLFYRKMWKQGLLAALVMVLLSIPGFMEIIVTFNPSFFGALPLGWLPAAYTIGEIGTWALKVILGMFAVSWYHESSKAQIEEIYMACPEGENRTELLVQRGGTNLLAAVLYFGIMCLLQVAILYMAGPSAIQYLMTMAGM